MGLFPFIPLSNLSALVFLGNSRVTPPNKKQKKKKKKKTKTNKQTPKKPFGKKLRPFFCYSLSFHPFLEDSGRLRLLHPSPKFPHPTVWLFLGIGFRTKLIVHFSLFLFLGNGRHSIL